MIHPSSASLTTKLRRTAWTLAGATVSAVVIALLFNASSVRTTLRCSRAAATPANCQIVTLPVWGEPQVQELPKGQLLKARLATERSLTAKIFGRTPAVILVTAQGEIWFSHQNTPNSGVSYALDERINTFLQASDAGSLEITVPGTLASRLLGLLVFFASVLWLFWVPSALWSIWFPASFTESHRPKSDWQQSSDRLNQLLQPPPQQIDLDDRQD